MEKVLKMAEIILSDLLKSGFSYFISDLVGMRNIKKNIMDSNGNINKLMSPSMIYKKVGRYRSKIDIYVYYLFTFLRIESLFW